MERHKESIQKDTSEQAAQIQVTTLRQMGLSGRAQMTFQLSDALRQISRAGIRHRHPEYTDQQVTLAYLRLILEPALFRQAFPGCEISA